MKSAVATGRRARGESGDTLIEVLVALVVMGIAFTVIVGGIGVAIIGAGVQQNNTTADSLIRSSAEVLTSDGYTTCATSYTLASPPAGFSVSVARVGYWDPTSNQFVYPSDPAGCVDHGLQLVTLNADASGPNIHVPAHATLDVVKRAP